MFDPDVDTCVLLSLVLKWVKKNIWHNTMFNSAVGIVLREVVWNTASLSAQAAFPTGSQVYHFIGCFVCYEMDEMRRMPALPQAQTRQEHSRS